MSNILGNMPPVFGSGYRGVVPAPSAADVSAQNILRADGTWGATPSGAIPSQTGNATKLLTTDGTNASWSGAVTVSGSNATVGGNLTVNSYVLSDRTAAANNAAVNGFSGNFGSDGTLGTLFVNVGGFPSATAANRYIFINAGDNQDARKLVLQRDGGNVLIGTTTDSGNGKIQLADHTNSAGGIGFGTDTSLYRTGTGSLAIDGGTLPILRFFNGATQYGYVYAGSSDGELACVTGPLRLKSNNTTALTLDSSQNATFANAIKLGAGKVVYLDGGVNTYIQGNSGTLFLGTNGASSLSIDSSQNATFAGKITANGAGSTFKGTATNDSAAAGYVGEIITSTVESGSAVSLSNTVISDVTSISLTAGDWDVDGNVGYSTSGATVTQFLQGIATASGTAGPTGSYSKNPMSLSSDSNSWFQDAPTWRVSISSTTTIYLIARSYFSAGTVAAYGFLRARRVR